LMEWVDYSLEHFFHISFPFKDEQDFLTMMLLLQCYAIHVMQKKQIVHQDIHIKNVLWKRVKARDVSFQIGKIQFLLPQCDFEIKIVDFGCSNGTINPHNIIEREKVAQVSYAKKYFVNVENNHLKFDNNYICCEYQGEFTDKMRYASDIHFVAQSMTHWCNTMLNMGKISKTTYDFMMDFLVYVGAEMSYTMHLSIPKMYENKSLSYEITKNTHYYKIDLHKVSGVKLKVLRPPSSSKFDNISNYMETHVATWKGFNKYIKK
jgi:hypothetical protein